MDLQNLMPQAAQPINRITTGQLPTELAELSEEEALQLIHGDDNFGSSVLPSIQNASSPIVCVMKPVPKCLPSYDGDDAE